MKRTMIGLACAMVMMTGMNNVFAANVDSEIQMQENTLKSEELNERRQELEEDGWVLTNTEYISLDDLEMLDDPYGVSLYAATVQGSYAVVDTYKQPIVSKSYTNSSLLNAVSNFSAPIATVISAGLPAYKWVPSAVGFVSRAVANLSASSLSTFASANTLYIESIMVKTDKTSGYCPYAEAQRYMMAATSTHTGYNADGSPFSRPTSKSLDVKSVYYDDLSFLTTMAVSRAQAQADSPFVDPYVLPASF